MKKKVSRPITPGRPDGAQRPPAQVAKNADSQAATNAPAEPAPAAGGAANPAERSTTHPLSKSDPLLYAKYINLQPGDDELLDTLEPKLRAIAGDRVARQHHPNLRLILDEGALFSPRKVRTTRGRPNKCHLNVALEYAADSHSLVVATGFGLNDGGWRLLSWLWRPEQGLIVETTVRREKYFGVTLDDRQAAMFVLTEIVPHLPGWDAVMAQAKGPEQTDPAP
jgi:hypothetical protein